MGFCAEMRPYQVDGFSFLCHLAKLKLGGNPRGRHGPGQDAADARLAEVAKDQSPEECQDQADSGCLPGLGSAQLAS